MRKSKRARLESSDAYEKAMAALVATVRATPSKEFDAIRLAAKDFRKQSRRSLEKLEAEIDRHAGQNGARDLVRS